MSSSSWSEIRLRTRNQFSSIIAGLVQKQNQFNAVNLEITDADTIMPRRILTSKSHINSLISGYARDIDTSHFKFPLEPDGHFLRMWYRFDHMGYPMFDLSYADNNCDVIYNKIPPTLIANMYDDGISGGRLHSIVNPNEAQGIGDITYYRISGDNKIKDIYESGFPGFSFFYRCFPIAFDNQFISSGTQRAVLFEEIDNDQVEYAVRIEGGNNGHLYFYVRFHYIDYYIDTTLTDPPMEFVDAPDFSSSDYQSPDFQTGEATDFIPDTAEYTDLFFTFDFETKRMKIIKNGVTIADSEANFSIPQTQALTMWLPMTQGNSDTIVDISGLDNHGDMSASPNKPTWTTHQGIHVLEFGDDDYFEVEKSASLNTLTSWSVSYIMYMHSDFYSIGHSKIIFRSSYTDNGRFVIYHPSGTSRNVNLDVVNNAGTSRFLNFGSNHLPATAEQFVHVVVTYDGSEYKGYVNKVIGGTTPDHSGDAFTNSNPLIVGSGVADFGAHANISHVMFWKNQALTQSEVDQLYDSLMPTMTRESVAFPVYQDEPPEPPPPGTPFDLPFTQVYDNAGTTATYKKANAQTVSGVTNVYNVGGGTPVEDPQTLEYDVAPGVGSETTTGPQTIYNLAGNSSDATIPQEKDFGGQRIKNTSSVLYNQKITEITVRIRTTANSLSGELRLGVIKSNGNDFIQFGASIAGTTITGSFQSFTRTNSGNTYQMQVGDAVGVYWFDADDTSEDVIFESAGSGVHTADGANSRFSYKTAPGGTGDWTEDSNRSVAMTVKNAGGTTITSPYLQITGGNSEANGSPYRYYAVGEVFPSGSPIVGKTPTKIEMRVYRHASATAGTMYIRHVDNNNTVKATLHEQTITSLPTTAPTTFNITWENLAYDKPIAVNDRILVVLSGANTNPVYVLGNDGATGSNASYDGTRTYVSYRRAAYPGIFGGIGAFPEAWTSNTARDISGKIYQGGNSYSGYTELWNTRWRTGVCVNTDSSSLKGKIITKVTGTFKKVGTPPSGSIFCRIRSFTGAIRTTIQQKDVSEVNSTDTAIDFINTTHGYPLATGDLITLEYELGTSTDHILVRNNKDVFEGTNTCMFTTANSSDTAILPNDRDLTAQLYIGGELDTTARSIVGLRVNHPASIVAGKAITKAELYLKRVGSFGGGELGRVKIIRWSDKVTVSTLETIVLNDIPTTETLIPFENPGNSYPLADGDIVAFENTFGDVDNYIQVKISDNNTLDDTKTQMIEYDGTTYFHLANDLAGKLYTGGYTVYPDPSIPNPPQPYHYNHKLYIAAGLPDDSGGLVDPDTLPAREFSGAYLIMDDFRLYADIIDEERALNLFTNKYTTSALEFGEIKVIGHDKIDENE